MVSLFLMLTLIYPNFEGDLAPKINVLFNNFTENGK